MSRIKWYPENYSPKLSVEDWKYLLKEKTIFSEKDLEILKRFLDFGVDLFSVDDIEMMNCKATLQQLVYTYGEQFSFYKDNIYELGKKIFDVTSCDIYKDASGYVHYENILFVERIAGTGAKKYEFYEGILDDKIYRLRNNLVIALFDVDLSFVKLYTDVKIAEKINLALETTNNRDKIRKSIEKLRYIFLDSNGKIPIKSTCASDDDKNYFVKKTANKRDNRLADKVATNLLAKGLAYKISEQVFESISEKNSKWYVPITQEKYDEIKDKILV